MSRSSVPLLVRDSIPNFSHKVGTTRVSREHGDSMELQISGNSVFEVSAKSAYVMDVLAGHFSVRSGWQILLEFGPSSLAHQLTRLHQLLCNSVWTMGGSHKPLGGSDEADKRSSGWLLNARQENRARLSWRDMLKKTTGDQSIRSTFPGNWALSVTLDRL